MRRSGSGAVEVHPATADRFGDVAVVLAPRDPDAPACWCLSYRLPNKEFSALTGPERPRRLRRFAEEGPAPGVIAYVDGQPAGWCSVAPRAGHHRLVHSRTIPTLDGEPVWSVVCIVVRSPFRGQGLSRRLLDGAVEHARLHGAPALEAYPIDPMGGRVNSAFAYVGTTGLFESAGFSRVVATASRSAGMTRWLMRLPLTR